MRDKFLGYHKPAKEDLNRMWQEGTFVFDTSVLLNIYRYTSTTREDFFKILEHVKNRIWLPYQVAFEYHEQRENVIAQQNAIYDDIEYINKVFQDNVLNKYKKGHLFADMKKIEQLIKKAVQESKNVLKEAQSKLPDLLEEDTHLEKLKDLFDKKVGEQYPKEILHKIYEEAQGRYKENLPPGYKDGKNKDGPNAYGDVVLWYQILDYGKEHKIPMILVIDDAKEDWWRKDRDKKILGPRPELIQEFHEKTGELLYMYLADEFIRQAQQRLNIQIQPTTIKEAREIRQTHQTEPKEIYRRSLDISLDEIVPRLQKRRNELIFLREDLKSLEASYEALEVENEENPENNRRVLRKKIEENHELSQRTENEISHLELLQKDISHRQEQQLQQELLHKQEQQYVLREQLQKILVENERMKYEIEKLGAFNRYNK